MNKWIVCCALLVGSLGLVASQRNALGQQPPQAPEGIDALRKVVTLQTAAIKELNTQVEDLEKRVAALEKGETR